MYQIFSFKLGYLESSKIPKIIFIDFSLTSLICHKDKLIRYLELFKSLLVKYFEVDIKY